MELINAIIASTLASVLTAGIVVFSIKKYIENVLRNKFDKELIRFKSIIDLEGDKKKTVSHEQITAYKTINSKLYEIRNFYRDLIDLVNGHDPTDIKSLYPVLTQNIDNYKQLPSSHIKIDRKPLKELDTCNINKEFIQTLHKNFTFIEDGFFTISHDAKTAANSLNSCFILLLDCLCADYENLDLSLKDDLLLKINQYYENLNLHYGQAKSFVRLKYGIN